MKHAVADESAAVPDQDTNLADFLRKLHAGGDDFLAAGFAANDFEETHYVCRAEEMRTDHGLRSRRRRGNLVDIESGCVARKNGAGFRDTVQFSEDLFLEGHAFKNSFDHKVGV